MEPVTHFLSGAILARAGFNRKTAYATLAMTLAAEMPDLDVIWSVRGPVAGFEHHRGMTHTLLGAPFEALVVVLVMWGVHRVRRRPPELRPRWMLVWLFSMLAVLLHILLDFTNNYGVRPFYPFSAKWFAWSTVFIVDPFLLGVLLLGLLLPALLGLADREMTKRRSPFRGRGWAVAALMLMGCYVGVRAVEHAHAEELVRLNGVGGEGVLRVDAEPYPFSPFHWHAIVETPGYFQTAEVQTLVDGVTTSDANDRIFKPEVTEAVRAAKGSWLGRVYLGWAMFPVTRDVGRALPPGVEAEPAQSTAGPVLTRVDFEDLRFAYAAVPGGNEGRPPLSGSVYVAPDGQVEGMYLGEREQVGGR